MNVRRMVRRVELVFFRDDTNGKWGTSHKAAVNLEDSFNAVWDGGYIFHDVFEHAHEGTEFFSGANMMNLGGEMAASGALYYFSEDLRIKRFRDAESHVLAAEAMERNTLDLVVEACTDGDANWRPGSVSSKFGYSLRSGVPKQTSLNDESNIDDELDRYWDKVKETRCMAKNKQAENFACAYKKSVTRQKINDLHRWGWREANKCVPNTRANAAQLDSFISFWSRFCTKNSAEEMAAHYRSLIFYIYHRGTDIEWESVLKQYNGKRIIVHPDMKRFELPMVET